MSELLDHSMVAGVASFDGMELNSGELPRLVGDNEEEWREIRR
jgi:hypothetical protein